MKFTYGYWLNKPGVENADAVQIREVKVRPDSVYLYAVPYAQDVRAMGGPVLEMTISSPKQDILRTQAYHFMGRRQKEPQFELDAEACPWLSPSLRAACPLPAAKPSCASPRTPPPSPITTTARS